LDQPEEDDFSYSSDEEATIVLDEDGVAIPRMSEIFERDRLLRAERRAYYNCKITRNKENKEEESDLSNEFENIKLEMTDSTKAASSKPSRKTKSKKSDVEDALVAVVAAAAESPAKGRGRGRAKTNSPNKEFVTKPQQKPDRFKSPAREGSRRSERAKKTPGEWWKAKEVVFKSTEELEAM
jgi:hypothetical protein